MNKVAIITPVYNSEKYLFEMIESVKNQSYKDFDLVLVDDNSTDNSGNICIKYANDFNNIHYLKMNNNSGPGIARNKGLDFIRNNQLFEYFTFLDSDDIIADTYLERMVESAKISKASVVISRTTKKDFDDLRKITIIASNELYKNRKQYQSFPGNGVGAKIFHISLIDAFVFPKERHEDLFIIPSIILNEDQICLLDAALYFYRYRPESESHHNSFHPSMLDRLLALKHNLEFVLANGIDAKYHFYNEYFEYLNYLILITKNNKKTHKKLVLEKKAQLKIKKSCIISDIGKDNYYRYLLTEKSIMYKILSHVRSR